MEHGTGQESDEDMYLHVAYVLKYSDISSTDIEIGVQIQTKFKRPKNFALTC